MNNKGIPLEASFSPDSQFVFSGKIEMNILIYLNYYSNVSINE